MLRTLDIKASPAAEPLLEAVGVLRSDGTARPTGFLRPNSKWSRLLRTQSDHRLWETAVLFHLRDAFRAGDVWLARSRRYGDISERRCCRLLALMPTAACRPRPVHTGTGSPSAGFALDEGLRRLAGAARAGATAGDSIEDSVLRVERTEGAVPDGAADLVADLYRRMPDARITDILLEVDDATRFTEAFTHLRTGEPCRDRIGLLNVLLAEGVNLGLRKMAEATTTHGFWELMPHRPLACGRRRRSTERWPSSSRPRPRYRWPLSGARGGPPPATASSSRLAAEAKPSTWSTPGTGPNPASRRYLARSPTGTRRSPSRPFRPPSTKRPTSSTGS